MLIRLDSDPVMLQRFADEVKSAVVAALRASEKFSAIRLQNTNVRYVESMCNRGLAYADGRIRVTMHEDPLQLAGTVIHELAHQLVGTEAQHNEDWIEALRFLGVTHEKLGQIYEQRHFRADILARILKAIEA